MQLNKEDEAIVVVRMPIKLKRKLKIIAAYENTSMSEKVKKYVEKCIEEEGKNMEF